MTIHKVPGGFATIQAAVNASKPYDGIEVALGYAGGEFVNVTVNGLTFWATATITASTLVMAASVTDIWINSAAGFRVVGNSQANTLKGDALEGGAGDDVLSGDVFGNASDDNLQGGTGNDWLWGGSGDDWLVDGSGDDQIFGGPGDDRLVGGSGADSIQGGYNDDWLVGGSGDDTLDGGDNPYRFEFGRDTVSYLDTFDDGGGVAIRGVTVNLLTGRARDNWGHTDTLTYIENVYGSKLADTLTGNDSSNELNGGPGNDKLAGGMNSDTLIGGAGADTLDGGVGIDSANYFDALDDGGGVPTRGVEVNLLTGKATDNWGHADTLVGIENVYASDLDDTLTGDANDNDLKGNAGNDALDGGAGNDSLDGGLGEDRLWGGTGRDWLSGRAGNDHLLGGADADTLRGGRGADRIDGGADLDVAYFLYSSFYDGGAPTRGVDVNLLTGTATDSWGYTDTLIDIENVYASDLDDTLTGDGNNNLLLGADGNDKLTGGGGGDELGGHRGDDWLSGGLGRDMLDGGAGLDTADYGDKTQAVSVSLNGATNAVVRVNGVAEDTILNIENVTGGSGADTLTGDGLANVFRGGAGKDMLDGGAGLDTADYVDKTQAVSVSLNGATNAVVRVNGVAEDTILNIENVTGGSGADTLIGDGLANVFRGGAGKDMLDGGAGLDTADYGDKTRAVSVSLDGAANAVVVSVNGVAEDTIYNIENVTGGSGNDTLTGDGLANTLAGGAGKDVLDGGSGNDTLTGGLGKDVLDGGAGLDTADYGDKTQTVSVSLNGTTNAVVRVNGVAEDTVRNIENVTGGSGDDTLIGDGLANTLAGGAGFDVLDGGAGADTADYGDMTYGVSVTLKGAADTQVGLGGYFKDTIRNIENVTGGSGSDTLTGDEQANRLVGGAGIDYIKGGIGKDVLDGGSGNDTLDGGSDDDTLDGGSGNDVLRGGLDKDVLDGGLDVDTADYVDRTQTVLVTLNGATNAVVRVNGVAEDTIRNIENVRGGWGDDTLTGDGLANRLEGMGGNDVLRGGLDKDVLDGGAGLDTADYGDKTQGVSVSLNGAAYAVVSVNGVAEDTIYNIENVTGGSGNDTLTGDGLANVFRGGAGKDMLEGGAGLDTADYSDKTQAVSVSLNGWTNAVVRVNGVAEDTILNIENVTGGSGNDKLTGDGLANVFRGGAGKDMLDGGAGLDTADYGDKMQAVSVSLNGAANAVVVRVNGVAEDTIYNIENVTGGSGDDTLTGDGLANTLAGGAGNDMLRGGSGQDMLDGGAGVDTADYGDKTQAVSVSLNGATNALVRVNGVAEDTIRNFENVTGGSGADKLTGDGLANVFRGGAGKDMLEGGAGLDTADYSDKTQAVSVSLNGWTNAVVRVNGVAEDTILNIENVTGGSGSDTLTGDWLVNVLVGGSGNDLLNGGAGNDVLFGGLGNDEFLFSSALNASTNIDSVRDFNVIEDTIRLENAIFTALSGTGILSSAQFVANASGLATGATDRVVYETDTGKLFYDSDGNGAGGSVQFALLSANLNLSHQDFLIV